MSQVHFMQSVEAPAGASTCSFNTLKPLLSKRSLRASTSHSRRRPALSPRYALVVGEQAELDEPSPALRALRPLADLPTPSRTALAAGHADARVPTGATIAAFRMRGRASRTLAAVPPGTGTTTCAAVAAAAGLAGRPH